jgi:hypothetical protein
LGLAAEYAAFYRVCSLFYMPLNIRRKSSALPLGIFSETSVEFYESLRGFYETLGVSPKAENKMNGFH